MLRLSIKSLSTVVKEFRAALPKIADTNSPQCCCLLEQVTTTQTRLSVRIPNQLYMSQLLEQDGFDTGGTLANTLVNIFELEERLKQLSKTQVSIVSLTLGLEGLRIEGFKASGDQVLHTTSCRIYAGAISDFPGEPSFEQELIGQMSAENFIKFTRALTTFGDHKPKKQGDGQVSSSPIQIRVEEAGEIVGCTINSSALHQAYMEVTCPASQATSTEFIISGHLLKFVSDMNSDPVNLYRPVGEEDPSWIQLSNGRKSIVVPTTSSSIYRVAREGVFAKEPQSPRIGVVASRVASCSDLNDGALIQATVSNLRRLLICEERPNLSIRDSQQIGTNNFSLAKIEPRDVAGEWEAVLCSYDFFPIVYETVKGFNDNSFRTDSVVLEIRTFAKDSSRQMHSFFIALADEEPHFQMRFINPIELAGNNIDQLDSGD